MSALTVESRTIEGRGGVRIDAEEGGRYLGIDHGAWLRLQRMKAPRTSRLKVTVPLRDRSALGEWCHEPAGILTRA
jgi:hypothetical protein